MPTTIDISPDQLLPEARAALEARLGAIKVTVSPSEEASSSPKMTADQFWQSMALLDWTQGDSDAILAPLKAHLSTRPLSELIDFQNHLAYFLYQLNGKAYATHLAPDDAYRPDAPFSSDQFLYARAAVVANGQAVYERILAQPDQMIKAFTFEPILWVVPSLYKQRTGKPWEIELEYCYETYCNEGGWGISLLERLTGDE